MRCAFAFTFVVAAASALGADSLSGWTREAVREEIRPTFRQTGQLLIIETDARDGLDGFWRRSFPVEGNQWYEFRVKRRVTGSAFPQQTSVVTVYWQDAQGKRAIDSRPLVPNYLAGDKWAAPPEYPVDAAAPDADGWTEVRGRWQAPEGARQAVVELHGRWAAKTRFEWSAPEFARVEAPAKRVVRLATIHFRPKEGQTPESKRTQFAPLIAQAAAKKADLVVLPETLTYYGTSLTPAQAAETVPGPSTLYFGSLAKQHGLYIVAGIWEKDGHKVYNTAILMDPDGKLAGKYRKVTLPDSEAAAGVVPGQDYPVFETKFGKLGMMICYDGFFPEVARELTKRGAEVIAWPVWGCNPDLAKARAAENHVVLVSSTYEDVSTNWMLSAVWDRTGRTLAQAKDWGTVVMAEVDLADTVRWRSLGDFRSKIERHVPMTTAGTAWH